MSPTHYEIYWVVVRTCGRHNVTTTSNPSSTFSMIPHKFHFRKYHIPISLSILQPGSYTVWRKKYGFDHIWPPEIALCRRPHSPHFSRSPHRNIHWSMGGVQGHSQGLTLYLWCQPPVSNIVPQWFWQENYHQFIQTKWQTRRNHLFTIHLQDWQCRH